MAYITLQIGQCGNQLGYNFFNTLSEIACPKQSSWNYSFLEDSNCRFFSDHEKEERRFAHAVMFDTEPKVIKGILNSSKDSLWSYHDDCFAVQQQGAGNNWAMGYKGHGPAYKDDALNKIRRQVECCDQLQGFLVFSSVAGGTGSGLGSYLSEILRDEFPSVSSASVTVWPFQKGEISVQAYNAILSLAALQKSSDAIIIFENDWLLKLCRQKMGIKDVTMTDLNSVASQQLANLLLPVEYHMGISPNFCDLLGHLVPHPQFKLLCLRSVPQEPLTSLPFSAHTWPGLLRALRRMVLYNSVVDEVYGRCNSSSSVSLTPPVSLANLLILRGRDSDSADCDLLHKPSLPYSSWVPSSMRLKMWTNPNSFLSYDRTALLANNGQLSVSCVDMATSKAWKMFSYKAYFHHYAEHGLSEEDFLSSMMLVEQIVASYKSLIS